MKKLSLFILLVLFSCGCNSGKKDSIIHYKKAQILIEKKKYAEALNQIDSAIVLDSANLDFYLLKGKVLAHFDHYEQAIRLYYFVANKNYKLDTVHNLIGKCYVNYGNYEYKQNEFVQSDRLFELAIKSYDSALDNNIQYLDVYIGKTTALHNLNRFDEALITLNSAYNIFPDSMQIICIRGVEKLSVGDYEGALKDLNQAISSNELDSANFSLAYRFRAILFKNQHLLDKAISDFTCALKYDANEPYVLVGRAECYKQLGLKDKACDDFRKAAELGYVSVYEIIEDYCNH